MFDDGAEHQCGQELQAAENEDDADQESAPEIGGGVVMPVPVPAVPVRASWRAKPP